MDKASLGLPESLHNAYWMLRHGRSLANENRIIVSHLRNGVLHEYSLAPVGVEQAELTGSQFRQELEHAGAPFLQNLHMWTSPFSRTVATAHIIAKSLGWLPDHPHLQVSDHLRERFFGDELELQTQERYGEAWALDARDPTMALPGAESVRDVAVRVSALIAMVERDLKGCAVLLVGHGDTLSILKATLVGTGLCRAQFREEGECHSDRELEPVSLLDAWRRHTKFGLRTAQLSRLI